MTTPAQVAKMKKQIEDLKKQLYIRGNTVSRLYWTLQSVLENPSQEKVEFNKITDEYERVLENLPLARRNKPPTQDRSKKSCSICFDNYDDELRAPYVCVPCGHCFCLTCLNETCKTGRDNCAICRKQTTNAMKIFL